MSLPDSGSQPDAVIRLARVLERTSGPGLFIIVGLLDAERQQAANQVWAVLDGEVEDRDLSLPPSMEEAVEAFFSPCEKRGVMVTHFQTWLTYESWEDGSRKLTEESQRFLSKINFGRPRLGDIGRPCLLLVPPFVTDLLAEWAPDFYDFRLMEAVLHDGGCEPIKVKPFMESGYEPRPYRLTANREERQSWIRELKERLAVAGDKGSPHDWVRLYKLLREEGANSEALEAHETALRLWERGLRHIVPGDPLAWKQFLKYWIAESLEHYKYQVITYGARRSDLSRVSRACEVLDSWYAAGSDLVGVYGFLSSCKGMIGDYAFDVEGDYAKAKELYEQSLSIAQEAASRFGETFELLLSISASLERLADLQIGSPEEDNALRKYEEVLDVRRNLLAKFGERPESLGVYALALVKVGDYLRFIRGDFGGAISRYREGVEIFRRVVNEFGETPYSLRDVVISLSKLGDIMFAVNDFRSAQTCYVESLSVAQHIILQFGETPEALRDLSLSFDHLGELTLHVLGDKVSALAQYRECLSLRRRILAEFGETPQALEDVALSIARFCDITDNPCEGWREALSIMRTRNIEYEESRQSRVWEAEMLEELIKRGCEVPKD